LAFKLPNDIFKCVVENTPLISIDLIVEQEGKFLLGKRRNPPAKGYYFVPGGRIYKDEPLKKAFERITNEELGKIFSIERGIFFGVFEHLYSDSIWGDKISTHYIVLAFFLSLKEELVFLPEEQHSEYVWLRPDEILKNPFVHEYTKEYFLRSVQFRSLF